MSLSRLAVYYGISRSRVVEKMLLGELPPPTEQLVSTLPPLDDED